MTCPWCGEFGAGKHKTIAQSRHRGLFHRSKGYYCYVCRKTFTVIERVVDVPFSKRRKPGVDSTMEMFAS